MRFNAIQCNLNHAWGAHNLLHQHMLEGDVLFALVSEPVCIPTDDWQRSKNGMAAICWKSKDLEYQCKLEKQGP